MNKFLQLLLAILLCQNLTQAQSTEYFDGDWKPCQEAEALYYRQITYGTDGRPEGVVRDHYIGGELQGELCRWSESGKEEGVLDESGFFYSRGYLVEILGELGRLLGDNLGIDALGMSLLNEIGGVPQRSRHQVRLKNRILNH